VSSTRLLIFCFWSTCEPTYTSFFNSEQHFYFLHPIAIAANCRLENEWGRIFDWNNRRPPTMCCSGRWPQLTNHRWRWLNATDSEHRAIWWNGDRSETWRIVWMGPYSPFSSLTIYRYTRIMFRALSYLHQWSRNRVRRHIWPHHPAVHPNTHPHLALRLRKE
jgi:hypothetical protein